VCACVVTKHVVLLHVLLFWSIIAYVKVDACQAEFSTLDITLISSSVQVCLCCYNTCFSYMSFYFDETSPMSRWMHAGLSLACWTSR
jgi:hypothetical protein